ncbi:OTU deubiquitinase with linear linkage specificity a [Amia ocellicauda]|uniref:OTU deubiquitinase with linear linkage specificity a n=1 Tax=Amia ocellicauda TaxID=2972642 RepID=UPI003464BC4F|nr:YAED1 protein [Amia calva]
MSWVKAVPSSGEDVFDEDVDDLNLQSKEWICNMEKRVKDGYRDGVDEGKEASLQHGFNAGYRQGALGMAAIGQLKGVLSALQCWCRLQPPDTGHSLSMVNSLLQAVVKQEELMIERLRTAPQPANVGDITDVIEDMGMGCPASESSGSGCCRTGEDQGSGDSLRNSCTTEQSLGQLIKDCADLVENLRLPEELLHHLHQLKST